MKKFRVISIIMAVCMVFGSLTVFAAKGDFAVVSHNPAEERIMYFTFDEGFGSGINDNGWTENKRTLPSVTFGTEENGNKYIKCSKQSSDFLIALGYGQNGAVSKPLEAGWYRVDFDIKWTNGNAGAAQNAFVGFKTKDTNTLENADRTSATYVCNTYDNMANNPGDFYEFASNRWRVKMAQDYFSTKSAYFKADGTKYWMLALFPNGDFGIDNVALYKVGEASEDEPPRGIMFADDLAGKEIKVTSEFSNKTSNDLPVTVINAIFDEDNNLVDVDFKTVGNVYKNHGAHPEATAIDLKNEAVTDGYTIKTYVWNGMDTMIPYCGVVDVLDASQTVANWDFEDGTTQGFTNVLGTTFEVIDNGGNKRLKITSDTGSGETTQEETAFRTPIISNLLNKYGPGKYKLSFAFRKAFSQETNVGGIDKVNIGLAEYCYGWNTTSVYQCDNSKPKTDSSKIKEIYKPGNALPATLGWYIGYTNEVNKTTQWTTKEIEFTIDSDYGNLDSAITFAAYDSKEGPNEWYMDDVKIVKVND